MPPRDTNHSRNPEPAGSRRENHRCRRGRKATDKLTSTEGFTQDLPLSQRKLILFLVVVFIDPKGTLQTMYTAIAERWGDVEGHWAQGKTPKKLTETCARYIGSGASRLVPWDRIEDTARAALPEETATWVLTYAAGLYNEVRPGQPDHLKDGYAGDSVLPLWAEGDTPVKFDTIAAWLDDHKPQLTLPSTVFTATTKRGPSGASPSGDLSEVTVPAQPRRNGLDAADVVAQLERIERERDEFRAELEVRRAADIVTQEELRLRQEKQAVSDVLIAWLTRYINRLMHWSEGKQPVERTPLGGCSTVEVQRRYEEAQHTVGVLRERALLADAGDQDCDRPSDPAPGNGVVRSKQENATADAPVIGVGE